MDMLAKTEANMSIGSRRSAAALLTLLSVACMNRSSVSRTEPVRLAGDFSTRVTAEELSHYAQGHSLMEALRMLRPRFLSGRGELLMVSVDGAPASDQSILSTIRVSDVLEVRLVKAGSIESRATIRPNGEIVVGDFLLVVTRKR
jgi:hypothetical protein